MMQRLATAIPAIQARAANGTSKRRSRWKRWGCCGRRGSWRRGCRRGWRIAGRARQHAGYGRAGQPAAGRILEAHVDARHLIACYGTPAQRAAAAADVIDGHLFALWVADPPEGALRMIPQGAGFRLEDEKCFAPPPAMPPALW